VPARTIKRRFEEEEADALERIAWWDWDYDTIKARLRDFLLPVEDFIARNGESGGGR